MSKIETDFEIASKHFWWHNNRLMDSTVNTSICNVKLLHSFLSIGEKKETFFIVPFELFLFFFFYTFMENPVAKCKLFLSNAVGFSYSICKICLCAFECDSHEVTLWTEKRVNLNQDYGFFMFFFFAYKLTQHYFPELWNREFFDFFFLVMNWINLSTLSLELLIE